MLRRSNTNVTSRGQMTRHVLKVPGFKLVCWYLPLTNKLAVSCVGFSRLSIFICIRSISVKSYVQAMMMDSRTNDQIKHSPGEVESMRQTSCPCKPYHFPTSDLTPRRCSWVERPNTVVFCPRNTFDRNARD